MLVHGHKWCQAFPRYLQIPRATAFHWRAVFWRLSFCAPKDFQVALSRRAICHTFSFLLFRLHCCNIRMCNLISWALGFAHVIACCGRGIWCFTHTHTCTKVLWLTCFFEEASLLSWSSVSLTVGRNLLSWSYRRLIQATELPCLEVSKICTLPQCGLWASPCKSTAGCCQQGVVVGRQLYK